MYEWTRNWIRLRREHAAVRRGELIDLAFNDDVYVYGRKLDSEIIIIGINRAAEAKAVTAPAAYLELADGVRGVPLLGTKEPLVIASGALSLMNPGLKRPG